MTSSFDPSLFLATETESGFDTEYTPVPAKEYIGQIAKTPVVRSLEDGRLVADIVWKVSDEEATEATGLENPTVRQTLWLDTNEHGSLARGKGKNVQLGRLLKALGMNDGRPFTWLMFDGKTARISVKHKTGRDGAIEAQVSAVTEM